MKKFLRNIIGYFRNLNQTLTPSDRISLLALLSSLFSIWFSIIQYNDQNQESAVNRTIDSLKFNTQIQLQETQFNKQIELVRRNAELQDSLLRVNINNSVRPFLTIRNHFSDTEYQQGLILVNSGIGPAIINKIEWFYEGKKLNSVREVSPKIKKDRLTFWSSAIKEPSYFELLGFDALKSGSSLGIYYTTRNDGINLSNLEYILRYKLGVRVYYSSITEQEWVVEDIP